MSFKSSFWPSVLIVSVDPSLDRVCRSGSQSIEFTQLRIYKSVDDKSFIKELLHSRERTPGPTLWYSYPIPFAGITRYHLRSWLRSSRDLIRSVNVEGTLMKLGQILCYTFLFSTSFVRWPWPCTKHKRYSNACEQLTSQNIWANTLNKTVCTVTVRST